MNATVEVLVSAREKYLNSVSSAYDETLDAVVAAVAEAGSIGKADIGALVFWKRIRADVKWVARLHAVPDVQVREVTAQAVTTVRNEDISRPEAARQARAELASLPGLARGDALASALLLAAAPRRMAVYDRRADAGLKLLGFQLSASPGRYGRYMEQIDDLVSELAAAGHQWLPRDVDTALYQLGGPRD